MGTQELEGSAIAIEQTDLRYHLHPMTRTAGLVPGDLTVLESADGCYVTIKGKRYLDGLSGLGCVNIGYGNPAVCEAGYKALLNMSYGHAFGGLTNLAAAELAEKLVTLAGGQFARFFFASTGSDANESAVKIAYYYWRLKGKPAKRKLIARRYGYHGNTLVAASLTGIEHYHTQFGLPLEGLVYHADAPYPYRYANGRSPEAFVAAAAQSVEDAILEAGPENVAAFFAEPIQVTAGNIVPPDGYWPLVQAICKKHDVLFVCDEVVTGFGKTGQMFGFQRYGIEPDMITLAKGLTSGYFPMSAVGVSDMVNDVLVNAGEEFEHGFTNCAHPVGAAIALANIAVIEDGLVPHVRDVIEPTMALGLQRFAQLPFVGDVRGMGVIAGIEFEAPDKSLESAKAICAMVSEEAFARGVIGREMGATLGLCVPLIITADELDTLINVIAESISVAGERFGAR